jgi:molybdopterin-guanine dinucleotide biosynthesis protein A
VNFQGSPLWQHQLQTLRNTGAAELLISGSRDACYGGCEFTIIEDEIKNAGPLAGIASLLAAAMNPLVMVLAVDMPYMTAAYLCRLREPCSGMQGAVPEADGFFEGIAAIYPKAAVTIAKQLLREEDHSIQHFVRECIAQDLIKVIRIADDEAGLFKSLNTPSDLPGNR